MRSDLLIEYHGETWVVDAKWKLLDAADVVNSYGLKQGEFYQLFAYGKRYLVGAGQLVLVYPGSGAFKAPLERFDLEDGLWLDAVPLDLESGVLIGAALPQRGREEAHPWVHGGLAWQERAASGDEPR